MDLHARMQELWAEVAPPQPSLFCAYATKFQTWTEELCAKVEQEAKRPSPAGVIAVNQAYVLLLTRFFEWFYTLPKAHRTHVSKARGHSCVFQVFEMAFQRLKLIELSLTPPMLFLPEPAPPPPPAPRLAAIGLGILQEDD